MDCTIFTTVISLVFGTCFFNSLAYAQHPIPEQPVHYHFSSEVGQNGLDIGQNDIADASCDSAALPRAQRARFFSRTLPTGDLHQRYPYQTFKFYYYNRPYSSFNTSSLQPGAPYGIRSQHLYSREVFRQVYQDAEQQILDSRFLDSQFLDYYAEPRGTRDSPIESPEEQVARDKNFEHVDWLRHYRARHEWERQQAEREQANLRMESPIEFEPAKPASVSKPQP